MSRSGLYECEYDSVEDILVQGKWSAATNSAYKGKRAYQHYIKAQNNEKL